MSESLQALRLRHEFTNRHKGTITPFSRLDLVVEAGEFVAIVGESGAGKTTLLLACGGLRRPTDGTVQIVGTNLYDLSPRQRTAFRAAHVGFVFQTIELIPYLSLWDNLMVVPGATPDQVERWTKRLGLNDRSQHLPNELSQGERQRTALARALVHGPTLVLADEPSGNLDAANSKIVFDALASFAENGGSVVVATHDLAAVASSSCSRLLRLQSGKLSSHNDD